MKYPPLVLKQKIVIIGLAAVLWVPMTLFLIFFSERFTERQMAGFGLVNMVMAMTVLVWSFRTWVQKIK